MTKIEQVARAICDAHWHFLDYWENSASDAEKEHFLLVARAAVEVMQGPTGTMKDAGADTLRTGLDGQPSKCWQAMLDAVIAESP